jgi:hypothetical protein
VLGMLVLWLYRATPDRVTGESSICGHELVVPVFESLIFHVFITMSGLIKYKREGFIKWINKHKI